LVRVAPGECFDQPTGTTDNRDIQLQPCSSPHDAEAISSTTHPAAPGAPYPTVDELRTFMRSACVPGFATYTGSNFDSESGLDFGLFYPIQEKWNAGERDVVCYVSYTDRTKLTSSLRDAGASITPST
jgi:hypothetical protein